MAATTRATGRSGGGTPKQVEGAPTSEPEVGPSTPSGSSSANAEPPAAPAPPEQPDPEQPAPPAAPRLNERVSVFDIGRALAEGYACRAVAMVQGALSGLGYDPGPFDGLGRSRTRSALQAFAADRQIELTDLGSLAEALDALGFDV